MAIFKRPKTPKWISQLRQTYQFTRPVDPAIRWILPLVFVSVTAALAGIGLLIQGWGLSLTVTSPAWGLLATTFTFGRRAERAMYAQIEHMPGAAGQVLTSLRGAWFVTQAVEINRAQEVVHRIVGRPGVILVIEARPGSQIAQAAKQRTQRWIGEAPLHEIYVGTGEGQTRLKDLNRTVRKLKKALRGPEVTELRRRLEAAGTGPNLPIPKGPMPKGMRAPRR